MKVVLTTFIINLESYLPKVGSKGSIATERKILQNRGDFEFEASVRSTLAHNFG